ncbi:MAG: hypothetical protein Q8O13_08435 [Candidatus Omnitrophota bacterium]|nr:hypothetical protein [Candidatus Omnitrophota bacterium]
MEMTSYFKGLLKNIEPEPNNVKLAKKSHEEVRDFLIEDGEISKANPETFLSGSYARETAINDIKDVDIILIIDLNRSNTEPVVTLAWLQASLQNKYSKVKQQGRSVNVVNDKGFNLDIVPATPVSNRSGPLWIPDREAKAWVSTHPNKQIEFSSERNKDTEGYYVHLIKIIKFWRDRLVDENSKPNSYIIESLLSQCILSKPDSYGAAIKGIFYYIYSTYQTYLSSGSVPNISDPGYPNVNVAKRWSFDEFSKFMVEVKNSLIVAAEALESQDESESIKLWRKLFGSKFVTQSN